MGTVEINMTEKGVTEHSEIGSKTNFLAKYRDPTSRRFTKISAKDFLDCWQHYDLDGNGYLEGTELDSFLREFVTSVIPDQLGNELVSETMFEKLKSEFMDAYDVDGDGRINISEMVDVLPSDESFVAIFCNEVPLSSSVEFIRIWHKFDANNDGYIEADELVNFLNHLLSANQKEVPLDKVQQYADTIIELFDKNKDRRLQLSEMSRLLRVKENFLAKPLMKKSRLLCSRELQNIFKNYDRDGNGQLDEDELDGLLKDFLEASGQDCEQETLVTMRKRLLDTLDEDGDGKIGVEELRTLLIHGMRMSLEADEPEQEIEKAGVSNI
ncbi:unnamed protein product [Schistocephalus solidus]|uniref:Calbindin-32 n=1 Tax=Schistocephalus solidus TaxID=70667 RepID=A0A183T1U7_SCHSO|nr:unnamed protein product [Schistocephalus solidus]